MTPAAVRGVWLAAVVAACGGTGPRAVELDHVAVCFGGRPLDARGDPTVDIVLTTPDGRIVGRWHLSEAYRVRLDGAVGPFSAGTEFSRIDTLRLPLKRGASYVIGMGEVTGSDRAGLDSEWSARVRFVFDPPYHAPGSGLYCDFERRVVHVERITQPLGWR